MSQVYSKSAAASKDKNSSRDLEALFGASSSSSSSSKGNGTSTNNPRKRAGAMDTANHRSAGSEAVPGQVADMRDPRRSSRAAGEGSSRHHAGQELAGSGHGHRSSRDNHGHGVDDHGASRAKLARTQGAEDIHHQQHRFAMYPSSPAAAAAAGQQHQAQLDQQAQFHAAQLHQQYMQMHTQMIVMQSQMYQDPNQAAKQQQQSSQREYDGTNVYVAHLPHTMTHEEFFQLMGNFGTVVSSRVLVGDHWRKKGVKGVGFARMATEQEALAAIKGINSMKIPGGEDNMLRARLAFKTIRVGGGANAHCQDNGVGNYAGSMMGGQQAAAAYDYSAAAAAAAASLPYAAALQAAGAMAGTSAAAGGYAAASGSPYYDPTAASGGYMPQTMAATDWAQQLGQVDAATAAAAAAAAAMAQTSAAGGYASHSGDGSGLLYAGVDPAGSGGPAHYMSAGSQSPAFTWDDMYGGITATADSTVRDAAYQNYGASGQGEGASDVPNSGALSSVLKLRTRRPGSFAVENAQKKPAQKIVITAPPSDGDQQEFSNGLVSNSMMTGTQEGEAAENSENGSADATVLAD